MPRSQSVFSLFCAFALLSGACTPQTPTPKPVSTDLYPVADPPSPGTQPAKLTVTLDPVRSGDTQIRGIGPAGLPIRVVDVSQVGAPLGAGVIGQDGAFTIELTSPALAGSRVGVLLGDLVGTSFRQSDFAVRDVPLVGPVVASQIVAP